MKKIPKELIFNGQYYSMEELHSLAISLIAPGRHEWEHLLGQFLLQWLDEKDFVTVKTSGSTGAPKISELSKVAMLTSATMTGGFLGLSKGQTALLCLRAGYIAGMMMVVRAMAYQMNLVAVPPEGSPLDALPDNTTIDFAAMVPAQVFNSLKSAGSKHKLASIGTLIIGGAPVSPELEKVFGNLNGRIYATFGMTETITHIALRRMNGPERSDIYTVLPGINIGTDERGCLVADVPYLAEKKVVTNDLVSIGSPGTFRWLGRADHVINCGGIKLIPEEIEKKIASVIDRRFFIAGMPDHKLGEIPVIVLETSSPLSEQEKDKLTNLIQPLLSKAELPRHILQSDGFAETENGKVKRGESLKNAF